MVSKYLKSPTLLQFTRNFYHASLAIRKARPNHHLFFLVDQSYIWKAYLACEPEAHDHTLYVSLFIVLKYWFWVLDLDLLKGLINAKPVFDIISGILSYSCHLILFSNPCHVLSKV